jgi:Expansin C-terminal domain
MQTSRNWGANWQANGISLNGQALSFTIMSSDWKTLNFPSVVPNNWIFGQTYEGYANFW